MEDLLKLVAKGDERAFKEIYEKTKNIVYSYIYQLCGDKNLAKKITIKTYVEVWKSNSTFVGKSKVETWILRIAKNPTFSELKLKNLLRKKLYLN